MIKRLKEERKFMFKTSKGYQLYEDNDVIIKITDDKTEYDNALVFLKRPSPYFIKFYSAQQIGEKEYEIQMERVNELPEKESEMVDLIMNTLGRQDYMLDMNRRLQFKMELKRNPEWYEDLCTYDELTKMIFTLLHMYEDAEKRGITLYDLRPQNLGVTREGRIVHFDIGSG